MSCRYRNPGNTPQSLHHFTRQTNELERGCDAGPIRASLPDVSNSQSGCRTIILPVAIRPDRDAAFSDESKHSDGRFRSIGTVSLDAGRVLAVSAKINSICSDSDVREFKWRRSSSAHENGSAR